jgi:hypothetical protein
MKQLESTKQARKPGENSEAGKRIVRHNGLKHGVSSKLITPEEQASFDLHVQSVIGDLQPIGYLESQIAQSIAYTLWRKQKLYLWQEAQTNAQMRQALEVSAYPDETQRVLALLDIQKGVLHGSLPATLERLCLVLEQAGLPSNSSRFVVDDLERIHTWLEQLREKAMSEFDSNPEASVQSMALHTRVSQLIERAEYLIEEVKRLHSVLGEAALHLLMRYEGSLDRALYRGLAELRVLQDRRMGKTPEQSNRGLGQDAP